MGPDVLTTLIATSGLALTLSTLAVAAVWRRRADAELQTSTKRVERLTERVAVLEARLAPASSLSPAERTPEARTLRADPAAAQAEAGPTLIVVPDISMTHGGAGEQDRVSAELGSRFGAVWGMAEAGATPVEIARETALPVGQVELILGLRRPTTPLVKRTP